MYSLHTTALKNNFSVDFELSCPKIEIQSGECVFILGPNGSGKSSLLRIFSGLQQPHQGNVTWLKDQTPLTEKERRRAVSLLPESMGFPPKEKVRDTLVYFLQLSGFRTKQARHAVDQHAERWGLSGPVKQKAASLSRGLLQQFKIALVMLKQAEFYLLDEPFRSVDQEGAQAIWGQMKEALHQKKIVVAALLDVDLPSGLTAQQYIRFSEGKAKLG